MKFITIYLDSLQIYFLLILYDVVVVQLAASDASLRQCAVAILNLFASLVCNMP